MPVLYQLVHGPAIGRDAWHASVQCLEELESEPFPPRGVEDRIGTLVQPIRSLRLIIPSITWIPDSCNSSCGM